MMNDTSCTYQGDREATLVAYLYDELGGDDRIAFGRHLGVCARCRTEVESLSGVRTELGRWLPPEPSFSVAPTWSAPGPRLQPQPQRRTLMTRLNEIPAWAQTAAAVLLLGVSLGFANLDISYNSRDGLSVRTGWRHAPAAATVTPPAGWQNDLAAFKEEVRATMAAHASTVATPASSPAVTSDDRVERRLVTLLKDSEQRQQRELALRVAEVVRDMQTQRQADLVRIDRSLGMIQSRTGMDYMRTQRQVNSLAQQVSQRPQ